jgi:hypothetical protein
LSRDIGWRGCNASAFSSENSPVVSEIGWPSRVSERVARCSAKGPNRRLRLRAGRARRVLRRLAPQHGVDARHELARVEGLGEVVVRAHLEADDAVHVVALRGEHDDRHVFAPLRRRRQMARPSSPGA